MSSKLKHIVLYVFRLARNESITYAWIKQHRKINHHQEQITINCLSEESVVRNIFNNGNSHVISLPDTWLVDITKRDVSKISKDNPVQVKINKLSNPDGILITQHLEVVQSGQ